MGSFMPIAIYNLEPYGDMVLYEDHLVEVANLNHIIAALESELKIQAEQIAKLQKQLFTADNLIFELSQE